MYTRKRSSGSGWALRGLVVAALMAGGIGAVRADDQVIDLSSGAASFIGSAQVLDGGSDVLSFVNLAAGTYDFLLSISSQNIADFGATLNGQMADVTGAGVFRFAGLQGHDHSPFMLSISGTAGGSSRYSGELTVAAVPEPETYALMLAGLGLVAYMARRRRQTGFTPLPC